jgi:hypothetical protein
MMYAPCLPLRKRLTVGGWIAVPAAELGEDDVASPFAATAAAGLVRLYALEKRRTAVGAFVFREGVGVGGEVDGTDVRLMHRALAIGVLDINPPPPRLGEEGTGDERHAAMTSDNAIVYGHHIGPDSYVAAEYGAMIGTLRGGYNALRDTECDSASRRMHIPAMRFYPDGELVDAVHRRIALDTNDARRLSELSAGLICRGATPRRSRSIYASPPLARALRSCSTRAARRSCAASSPRYSTVTTHAGRTT